MTLGTGTRWHLLAACFLLALCGCQSTDRASSIRTNTGPSATPNVIPHAKTWTKADESPAAMDFEVALKKRCGDCGDDRKVDSLLERFDEAFEKTKNLYVTPLDEHALVETAKGGMENCSPGSSAETLFVAAMKAMLHSLDRQSDYMTTKEYHDAVDSTANIGVIGIEAKMENGYLFVQDVLQNGPAETIGLRFGDHITEIDGVTLNGLTTKEAVGRLRGLPSTVVRITIKRGGDAPFVVTVTRTPVNFKYELVIARLDDGVAYIRVKGFGLTTNDDLHRAINRLKNEAGGKPRGYILDLRNNEGGLLSQSVAVAGDFLDKGDIATTRGRRPEDAQDFFAHCLSGCGDLTQGAPIAILMNKETASGSEIVAGALRDNHRATLVGVRSNGTGSIQTIMPLQGGAALRLTTAFFVTPAGQTIEGVGIEPDITVPWVDPPDTGNGKSPFGDVARDVQYARAVRFLRDSNEGSK